MFNSAQGGLNFTTVQELPSPPWHLLHHPHEERYFFLCPTRTSPCCILWLLLLAVLSLCISNKYSVHLLHDCPLGSWSQLEPFWAFYSQQKCRTLCYCRNKWITNKQAALLLPCPRHFITERYHVHQVQFAHGKSMRFLVIFLSFMCLKMAPMKTSAIIFRGLRWRQPACCTPHVSVHLRSQLDTSGSDFYHMHNPWKKWHCFIWSVITWDYNHLNTFASNSKCRRYGNISSLITHSIVWLAQSFLL